MGKNLLIRFDSGLELRTHLRMNGSWHRYRPGERWRRPPSRARLVLEVPGAVAVCFDAPVVELFEQRAEALHPALAQPRPGPAGARLRRRGGASAGSASPERRDLLDQRRAARPAGARRHRQHLAQRDAVRRAGRPARAGRRPRRRHAPPARRDGPAPADGECRDRPGARRPDAASTGARDGRVRGAGRRSGRTSSAARTRGRRTGARRVRLDR